ncbi:hypothetical protein CL659_01555 [bacterium]|nr:hypothetical protein [bacterium]|tara:strand:+ start:2318 stop:2554 length:237 start_codon:yes stop_codon:yes gene_type:complete
MVVVVGFIQFYKLVLFARILLSWFSVDWRSQYFFWIADVTEPILRFVRPIFPRMGGIDFSPIIAFYLLDLITGVLMRL